MPLVAPPEDSGRPYTIIDGDLWFVDTGASRTTCDDTWVERQGLVVKDTAFRSQGEAGSVTLGRVVLRDKTIGGWRFARLPCAVRDLGTTSSLPELVDTPVAGILGANLFRTFVVDFHFAEATLHLGREGSAEGVPLRWERVFGPRLVADLVVDGVTIPVVIDSGADRTYLPLTTGPELARYQGARQGTGPAGSVTVEVVMRGVEAANIDGYELPLRRFVYREGSPGLLGMDALGRTRLVVDGRHRRMRWEEGDAPPFAAP